MLILVDDYYYNDSITAVLVSGQWNTSVNISTVDDNIVELNESLILRIERVLATQIILTEVMQPNSTLLEIIDNDGTVSIITVIIVNMFHCRNIC